MLLTSFVVAVPITHLRVLPKKGNRLLLQQVLLCMCPLNEGSVFKRLIAEMMVGLQELYISLIVVRVLPEVVVLSELVLQVGVLEIVVANMFYPVVC